MDNQHFFNLMRTSDEPSAVVMSSDGSWTFNSDSDTSLPTSRAVDVAEICPSVAEKICTTAKTTDTITKVVNPHPERKQINAHVISPTVTDEEVTNELSTDKQATDEQSTDKQSTDEQSIDEQSTDEQATDEQAPTVAVCPTSDHQQVRSSRTLLSFDDFYDIHSKNVCTKPQSLDISGVAYKRHMAVRVDAAVQVDIVNLQQGRASSPGGDAGNQQTPMEFQSGITVETRNMGFQRGDMKWRIPGTSIGSIDIENRRLTAVRCKPKVAKKLMINKDKHIIGVYMNQSNKVSTKPAPFLRRSSSYINRQMTQRETDRNNYMMVKKLISSKAEVSTFR
ncbi:uncharacterized protein LOC100570754 [Acyrthosiphon pisum]|uniref:Uncharacterized protein n=1 Tax=Acyrthosiphon pisum TaxID=7029 RepID=A0A8R2A7X5_ACYPI|nr:uncharacterized protein LOC100570754 [Acyrthosiphon pisum]|eukprot:XP_003244839.2 PREDICTED: uncharacterized protein LOC100570754 [Acyrthosiphon pisum]